jgi:predicted O-methyltransferase YrrM
MSVATASFWDRAIQAEPNKPWQREIRRIVVESEARRTRADYNTGSILECEAYALRCLAEYLQARVVVEVGTFIGASTCALASASCVQAVYTCDVSNNCVKATKVIRTYPKQTSTKMLQHLAKSGVKADLCFFDGSLTAEDVDLLAEICHASTVFAVHDYNYGPKIRTHGLEILPRKGIGNMWLLQPKWPHYAVVKPVCAPGHTLAALVPESML